MKLTLLIGSLAEPNTPGRASLSWLGGIGVDDDDDFTEFLHDMCLPFLEGSQDILLQLSHRGTDRIGGGLDKYERVSRRTCLSPREAKSVACYLEYSSTYLLADHLGGVDPDFDAGLTRRRRGSAMLKGLKKLGLHVLDDGCHQGDEVSLLRHSKDYAQISLSPNRRPSAATSRGHIACALGGVGIGNQRWLRCGYWLASEC